MDFSTNAKWKEQLRGEHADDRKNWLTGVDHPGISAQIAWQFQSAVKKRGASIGSADFSKAERDAFEASAVQSLAQRTSSCRARLGEHFQATVPHQRPVGLLDELRRNLLPEPCGYAQALHPLPLWPAQNCMSARSDLPNETLEGDTDDVRHRGLSPGGGLRRELMPEYGWQKSTTTPRAFGMPPACTRNGAPRGYQSAYGQHNGHRLQHFKSKAVAPPPSPAGLPEPSPPLRRAPDQRPPFQDKVAGRGRSVSRESENILNERIDVLSSVEHTLTKLMKHGLNPEVAAKKMVTSGAIRLARSRPRSLPYVGTSRATSSTSYPTVDAGLSTRSFHAELESMAAMDRAMTYLRNTIEPSFPARRLPSPMPRTAETVPIGVPSETAGSNDTDTPRGRRSPQPSISRSPTGRRQPRLAYSANQAVQPTPLYQMADGMRSASPSGRRPQFAAAPSPENKPCDVTNAGIPVPTSGRSGSPRRDRLSNGKESPLRQPENIANVGPSQARKEDESWSRPVTPLARVVKPRAKPLPGPMTGPSYEPDQPQPSSAKRNVLSQLAETREVLTSLIHVAGRVTALCMASAPLTEALAEQARRELSGIGSMHTSVISADVLTVDEDLISQRCQEVKASACSALALLREACGISSSVAVQDEAAVRHSLPHTPPSRSPASSPSRNTSAASLLARPSTFVLPEQHIHGVPSSSSSMQMSTAVCGIKPAMSASTSMGSGSVHSNRLASLSAFGSSISQADALKAVDRECEQLLWHRHAAPFASYGLAKGAVEPVAKQATNGRSPSPPSTSTRLADAKAAIADLRSALNRVQTSRADRHS